MGTTAKSLEGRAEAQDPPVILIDANNVCHIALHSMGDLSFQEMRTGVIFGFFIRLLRLWEEIGTNRFAFCWDSRKRFRSHVYPEYKANRKSQLSPEERAVISEQMDALRLDILPQIGFRNIYHQTGFEADDLIAALVQDDSPGAPKFIIVSTDKDLYQLLAYERCQYIYNTITGHKMTASIFRSTYSIEPSDWVKVKAMVGDSSDNIAGIPGIGEKSAIQHLLGVLKGKKEASIINSQRIIDQNMYLMELPLFWSGQEIKLAPLEFECLDEGCLIDIFDYRGFQSFLRGERLTKWREFIRG